MKTLHHLIKAVEAFAEATGTTPDLVCRSATGNPRMFSRLHGRAEETDRDIKRLSQHMSKAAPKPSAKQPRKSGIAPKVQS